MPRDCRLTLRSGASQLDFDAGKLKDGANFAYRGGCRTVDRRSGLPGERHRARARRATMADSRGSRARNFYMYTTAWEWWQMVSSPAGAEMSPSS